MGTNNFYPHSNGIFVVEDLSMEEAYENIKEMRLDDGEEIEAFDDIDPEILYNEINFNSEMMVEYLFENISSEMPHGMDMHIHSQTEAEVYNKQGKQIATLTLRGGYYEHAQIMVETDPEEIFGDYYPETQTELYELYTPHHQRLLKYIASYTTPIRKIGGFSNGEAVYELV